MKTCGVDPSRSMFAVSFTEELKEFDYRTYRNSPEGFSSFLKDLSVLNPSPSVCIEGYGDFAKQLALRLKHQHYRVYEVNPQVSRSLRESITVHKSDHMDSYTCALSYGLRELPELALNGEDEGFKNLVRLYGKLSHVSTAMKNQFHAALHQGYGCIYKEMLGVINHTSLVFYSIYGSIKELQESTAEEIHEVLKMGGSCRYKGDWGKAKAERIKALADRQDISGLTSFMSIQSEVIKGYTKAILAILEQKSLLEEQITLYVREHHPDYPDYFKDIKGMTELRFGLIVGEGVLWRQFRNEGSFASYSGQAPKQSESAGKTMFKKNRKYNRHLADSIHFLACQNVARNGVYVDEYTEAKKRYSVKLRALKKIKRKLARLLYYRFMLYKHDHMNNNIMTSRKEREY